MVCYILYEVKRKSSAFPNSSHTKGIAKETVDLLASQELLADWWWWVPLASQDRKESFINLMLPSLLVSTWYQWPCGTTPSSQPPPQWIWSTKSIIHLCSQVYQIIWDLPNVQTWALWTIQDSVFIFLGSPPVLLIWQGCSVTFWPSLRVSESLLVWPLTLE